MLLLAEGFWAKQYVTPRTHSTIPGFCMVKGLLFTLLTFLVLHELNPILSTAHE